MAKTTGVLRVDLNLMISRLDTGTARPRLAKLGPGNHFRNATEFLENQRNLVDGDFIFVEGTGVSIIFITDAGPASAAEVTTTTTGAATRGVAAPTGSGGVLSLSADEPSGGREVGAAAGRKSASRKPGAAKKSSGKAAKKDGAKSGATKKAAAKKRAAKKVVAKRATKKSAAKKGGAKKSASRKTRKGSKGK